MSTPEEYITIYYTDSNGNPKGRRRVPSIWLRISRGSLRDEGNIYYIA